MMRVFAALAALCLLTGCKVQYNKDIVCPKFEARGVAVWRYDDDTYIVRYPVDEIRGIGHSKKWQRLQSVALVNDTGCIVTTQR